MTVRNRNNRAHEKFKALVHFLVHECSEAPARLGSIRLNKTLWFIDLFSYLETGKSVTGGNYVKRERGPVPATILKALGGLVQDGKLIVLEPEHRYDARKFISLETPDISSFKPDELELAKGILHAVLDYRADEISELTHEEIWEAAQEGEEIPLYAILASGKGEITESVKEWAESIVEKLNLPTSQPATT